MTIRLTGDKAVDKKLAKLEKKTARKVLRRAVTESAKLVRAHTRRRVKQLDLVDSGALLKSIKPQATHPGGKRARAGVIQRFVRTGTRAELGISPADPAYYPAVLEYGTKDGRIPARSFMRSTFVQSQRPVNRLVLLKVKRMVRDI